MDRLDTRIADEVSCSPAQVAAVRDLFADGGTVPFIARYRKERTGGLDETVLRAILDAERRIQELETRREAILRSLTERALLTPDLERAIRGASDRTTLEDRYLPYRQRKQTRADRARERGLQQLADAMLREWSRPLAAVVEAHRPPDVPAAEAQCGAADILAESIALDTRLRNELRDLFTRQGAIESTRARASTRGRSSAARKRAGGARDDGGAVHEVDTYRDYFSWREPARRAPSHRVLAMLRGAGEGHLTVTIRPPEEAAIRAVIETVLSRAVRSGPASAPPRSREWDQLYREIGEDAWKRLLLPPLEREAFAAVRTAATEEALRVFGRNLETVLLSPPYGPRCVLAIDPGLRTGAKLACLAADGAVLEVGQIFPLPPHERTEDAARTVRDLCDRHGVEAIAVGDGTGGRETERFIRDLALSNGSAVTVISVHEAGASVYSASDIARKELPDLDVQYRGAVSIGRRLQDPLAELVKVDPDAIGVGQYQHDIDRRRLDEVLDATVESCVNRVGVDINTASVPLLARVAGLSRANAEAIVTARANRGLFARRIDIGAVRGIGPKTVEQAVGFLRCPRSSDPLENTGVHPERYGLVARIAGDLSVPVTDLVGDGGTISRIDPARYVDAEKGVGVPTVADILIELERPGRDPRDPFLAPEFDPAVREIDDLQTGMTLNGIVRNVVAFGAFVDIGVHRDGLVHVSEIADRYVSDPSEILRPGQLVRVRVLEVDAERKRINLSIKGASGSEKT